MTTVEEVMAPVLAAVEDYVTVARLVTMEDTRAAIRDAIVALMVAELEMLSGYDAASGTYALHAVTDELMRRLAEWRAATTRSG